jgi:hypothetical protein
MVLSNDNVTEGAMPSEEEMTIDERYKYLRIKQKRYVRAKRKERSQMLDEMQQVTGLGRKTLIRHMRRKKIERRARCRQRGKAYGAEVDDALRVIAESHDYICAERLQPNLVSMAEHLAAHGELRATPSLLQQLGHISVCTVRRRLKQFAYLTDWQLPRRKGPKPPNPVTRDIPMERIRWDEAEPGHFEVDLVHHSGSTPCGDYVHTVQMTDVATGWCEQAAVLGRSQRVMEDAFRHILARLPFLVREVHPDNGSEFFFVFAKRTATTTSSASGERLPRASNSPAAALFTRTTTVSSNRRTLPRSEPSSATSVSTPWPRPCCSISSTTKCGSTTTCSNL